MAIQNKVAIVTGAGSGVGKAATLALLKAGYSVALAGRRKDVLEQAVKESGAGSRALAVQTDVSDPQSVKALFAKAKSPSAGSTCCSTTPASTRPGVPLEELTFEQWKTRGRHQPDRHVPVHPGSVPDHEGPGSARRPHHQQRIDLRARSAPELDAVHVDQARA